MTKNGLPRRRIRVVHVTWGLEVGGQEKLLLEFARHIDRSRFELTFVSQTTRGVLAPELEALGWPVITLHESPGLRPSLIPRFARLFRRLKTDVVHTHDDRPMIYTAPAARLVGGIRVIHTRHSQSPWLTWRNTILVRWMSKLTHRYACVSQDSANLSIQQRFGPREVRTIWNGIDVQKYSYNGPVPGGAAVTVARMRPEKAIDNLIRAADLVRQKLPSFRVEIAGDGVCMAALQELVAQLHVENQVHFLGPVSDVPSLLARSGLFVLPSGSNEGIALALLEAMARGLPVVATRVGGNAEVVADGETGFLVPPQDPSALAQAMLRLLNDAELGRRMGAAGRRRVEKHFDIRRMVAEYEELYAEEGEGPEKQPLQTLLTSQLEVPARAALVGASSCERVF